MAWRDKFPAPIMLKDGRVIVTLADARALISTLPQRHQRNEHWQYAAGLLMDSAASGGSLRKTFAQLLLALKAEGMIDR
jgi:hypothetical protein